MPAEPAGRGRKLGEWLATRRDEVEQLDKFVHEMRRELAANADKGDRPGWLTMTPAQAVAEVLYHAGKLSVAVRQSQRAPDPRLQLGLEEVREYAADVANCALMVADIMGVLGGVDQADTPAEALLRRVHESPDGWVSGLPWELREDIAGALGEAL